MSKTFALLLGTFILLTSLIAGPAAFATALADNPTYAVVLRTPLVLDAVSSTSVCGSVQSKPNSRRCVGANSYEIFANDTVSKLEHFVLGAGQLCGVDERGPRCWSTRGTFEKPIQEILASGDVRRAQFADDKICIPKKDQTIHCYRPEQGVWIDSVPGNGKNDQYVRKIPPVEVFGPYADLRDFDAGDTAFCAIDGETVKCENYKHGNSTSGNAPLLPEMTYAGAKGISTTWNSVCVLSDAGLDCAQGSKPEELTKFHIEGPWKKAVKLFRRGYDSVCGVSQDETPMCIRLGEKTDEFTDLTPVDLKKPEIRVLKFKANADLACALIETKATGEKSLLCGGLRSMTTAPLGSDAVDFAVSSDATCTKNAKGAVTCFHGTTNMDSPLPEDGSASKSAGRCRWNDSRFHCATTSVETDFSDIAKVVAHADAEGSNLPCIIYENRTGLRQLKCFGSAEVLATDAPQVDAMATKITANYSYACTYGGQNTMCWGTPLGGAQPPNLTNVRKLLFGDDFGCASDEFGFVCWGARLDERVLAVPPGLGDLDSIRDFGVGMSHVCAITRDNQVNCWGKNDSGQTDVPPLTNPTSIVVSGNTNCASSDEGVTCWGYRQDALLAKGPLVSTQPAAKP